jgi:CheY-like chemotaxis protein
MQKKQENFLSNISHSIKTPLCGIMHFCNYLNQSARSLDDSQLFDSKFFESINQLQCVSTTLASNIMDIIDLIKLDNQTLHIQNHEFDLQELVKNVVAQVGNQIDYEISGEVPINIISDKLRLKQILINIIENAISYSRDSKPFLYIDSRASINDSNTISHTLSFTVCSDSVYDIEHIQNIFVNADDVFDYSRGISLRISWLLAKLLGGNLELISSDEKITSFIFNLDVCETSNDQPISDTSTNNVLSNDVPSNDILSSDVKTIVGDGKNTQQKTILLVEDDKLNNKILLQILHQIGYQNAVSVFDGETAINHVQTYEPNVVLLDIRLPKKSGFIVAKEIKGIYPKIKIVGVTAQTISEDDEQFVKYFDHILYKPINISELQNLLARQVL